MAYKANHNIHMSTYKMMTRLPPSKKKDFFNYANLTEGAETIVAYF